MRRKSSKGRKRGSKSKGMRGLFFIIVVLVLILAAAYLLRQQSSQQQQAPQGAQTTPAIGQRTKEDGCQINGPLQDRECTPGAIFPEATVDQICVKGYAKGVRNVPYQVKKQAYLKYGITHHSKGEYEVDHLISLELGGSNDISNLWPEAAEPRPGFHEKDKVENYLHAEVCAGRIPLKEAQREIANNWLEVYRAMGGRTASAVNDDEAP